MMDFSGVKSEDIKNMSIEELNAYCSYLRTKIIEVTEKNGGHLASNLGVVELSVALHYILDLPRDKVVWDVGHQVYAHKFITGRGEMMENLRRDGGASGFPSFKESEYDVFITGHSGTSLSMALGLCRARDLKGENYSVAAVIGDGAFTSGEIYEALNDLGDRPTPIILILNDNKMSISRNVGAMSKYFNKLRVSKRFVDIKKKFKRDLSGLPFVGGALVKAVTCTKNTIKEAVVGNKFFERFGLKYYGPYDGNDIEETINALSVAAKEFKPVIIHFTTQKGKGFLKAEQDPNAYHGIAPAHSEKQLSMSAAAGKALISLAESGKNIAVVTAAMADGLALSDFAEKFPERFYDVAIAEQHAVSLCAGMAKEGIKPFFGVYSTFLQRAFDQVMDVCINGLPVVFLIDRAGMVGSDGITHQGIFDLSYLSLIPGLTIASPKDGNELKELINFAAKANFPMAIRYAKSYKREINAGKIDSLSWETLRNDRSKVTVLAVGKTVEIALSLSGVDVINARVIKPLDKELLLSLKGTVITLEDNVLRGGFGESVRSFLDGRNKVITIGHGDDFRDERSVSLAFSNSGLTVSEIQKIIDTELLSLENDTKI